MRFLVFMLITFFLTGCGGETSSSGDRLYGKGEFEQAIEEYTKALETNPSAINHLYNRGRAYEEIGKLDLAEQDFLQVLSLDNQNLNANLSLSKLYYSKKAYNKAVIFADKALELNENSAQGHFLVARAKHQLGYVDSAMESYTLAININAEYGEAYLYRGALKIHKKQSKSACDDIRRAVNLDVPEAKAILKKYCK
jgi:tetratricopeptide (TPR) repeat protein